MPNRVLAFDLARGLAMLFMVVIHVLYFYGSAPVQKSAFGTSIQFLFGWPSATLFTFIMGVFLAYAKPASVAQGLKRAAGIFLLGYLLNVLRATIPTALSLEAGLVTYEQLGKHTPLYELLVVDIFQFAGIAYAICFLLRHYIVQPLVWLAMALMVIFISPLLWDTSSGIAAVDQVLKILWGHKHQGALFPLFPWLAYPLLGMAFGHWFRQSDNQKQAMRLALQVGIMVLLVGATLAMMAPEYHIVDNLRSGPGLIILLTGLVVIWLWLCQFWVDHLPANPFFAWLYFWSKHVTAIYLIHWVLIGWGLMLFGAEQLGLAATITCMFAVALLSDLLLRAWLWVKKCSGHKRPGHNSGLVKHQNAES